MKSPEATRRVIEALAVQHPNADTELHYRNAFELLVATILSATIVNVALPQVMGAFGIGQDHAQLISTAFLASVTGTMLLNGWLVDSFGCRVTYAVALVMFMVGSVVSGSAAARGLVRAGRPWGRRPAPSPSRR